MTWGQKPYNLTPKTGWRAAGFEDGHAGKPRRTKIDPEHVESYNEGYRIGKRERERAK